MPHPRGSAGRQESPCPRISIPYLFTPLIPGPGFQVDVSGLSVILDHQIQRALGTTSPPPSRTPLGAPKFFFVGWRTLRSRLSWPTAPLAAPRAPSASAPPPAATGDLPPPIWYHPTNAQRGRGGPPALRPRADLPGGLLPAPRRPPPHLEPLRPRPPRGLPPSLRSTTLTPWVSRASPTTWMSASRSSSGTSRTSVHPLCGPVAITLARGLLRCEGSE